VENGHSIASAFYPKREMRIIARNTGWAEQQPSDWWQNMKLALTDVLSQTNIDTKSIKAIGISYQMHGLVALDKNGDAVRPSIIWCDSRAVSFGEKAFEVLGPEYCLSHYLNSPGNFTASKLKWVKENEPDTFKKINKIMLPGDYIAYKLSGEQKTTISGLSEGILWDFKNERLAHKLIEHFGFDSRLIPETTDTFGIQGNLSSSAAEELGLSKETVVSYRAGDQPNNALSLNVLKPGEIAATAGTSGVVYGVSDQLKFDELSRVNTFAHVNHTKENRRLGILLCINGTGSLNSWLQKNVAVNLSYDEMNAKAATIKAGSDGLLIYPFGNGAERVLGDANPGASVKNLNLNRHTQAHFLRAAQEGIAFGLKFGIDIMKSNGMKLKVIRAGKANMFLSPLFRQTIANVTGAQIELYNTDGVEGAARGAAIGAGLYNTTDEAFRKLKILETVTPDGNQEKVLQAYDNWSSELTIIGDK
jgi:xylulokinase